MKNTITEGSIFKSLTKFSLPILLSLILQALYGAVDLWMVSQFSTKAEVAAVSNGSQVMMIVNGIITGLAMGITILLGESIGKKDDKRSSKILGSSIWVFLIIALIITVVVMTSAKALLNVLNVSYEAYNQALGYLLITGGGTIFVVAYNLLNGLFCGIGDSKTPLLFVGVATIVNIILDYILIDILQLGAIGAAIATIVAQATSVLFTLLIIKRKLPFKVFKEDLRPNLQLSFEMIKLGLPVAILRMCNEISYLVILGFVNKLDVTSAAGVGIAEKLVMFILLIPTAYISSISAFVAINRGAGNESRARKSLWVGMGTALFIGGIMSYLSFFHGDLLSKIFIKDIEVIKASSEFLKATSIECLILSIAYCFDGYFNGLEKTTFVMIQGVIASLLVRIPYAYFASNLNNPSLFNIGLSTAFAALFMLMTSLIYYLIDLRKSKKAKMSL